MHHEARGNRIQGAKSALGQDAKELGGCPRSERTSRRPVAFEADVPEFVSGGVQLPEQERRVHGQQQLPETGFCTVWRRELELPKLTFQVIRRTIATLAQEGDSEGHPRRA